VPRERTSSGLDLYVALQRQGGLPLRAQLEGAIRNAIRDGRLAHGTPLPSSRALADDLGVSRGVVVGAYDQLTAEGYLTARVGGVTRVAAWAAVAEPVRPRAREPRAYRFEFRPGIPDVEGFPRSAWTAAVRRAINEAPASTFSYGDPQGERSVRKELAAYLGRVRGVAADPSRVVICSGVTQGLSLVCRVLAARGMTRLAVEDPGWRRGRESVESWGLSAVPVPVDQEGIVVDALEATGAGAVMVTPSHQFPTGVLLSPARRGALAAWARRTNGLIIEDDYDAEYRYDGQPVGTLQGAAADFVVYAGSLSKTLAPALRLAWLVPPAHMVDDLVEAKYSDDWASPGLLQLALGHFIASGSLDRHRRRSRVVYRAKRDRLVHTLTAHAPSIRIEGIAAGLHLLARLPPGVEEGDVLAAGERHAVRLYGLNDYTASARVHPSSLVLGYGGVPGHGFGAALEALASTLTDVLRCRDENGRVPIVAVADR
jgi:GntR family transcriptional regulator/MocR family aminotransferase